jgi:hypothetical protein
MKWTHIALSACSAISAAGCLDVSCGKGAIYSNKQCLPAPASNAPADSGAPPDAAAEGQADGSADASSDCHPSAASFGATCSADAECPMAAPYCAISPGATTGYCSIKGCLSDPCLCPVTWSCFDLSIFGAGLPSFCAKP